MLESTARAMPVLPSLDIGRTRAFYETKLGFEDVRYVHDDYLIVRRGEIELHFWRTEDEKLGPMTSVYIRGEDALALRDDFVARGAEKVSPLMVRDWGMTEFYVTDPDGNLLRIGRPTEGG